MQLWCSEEVLDYIHEHIQIEGVIYRSMHLQGNTKGIGHDPPWS